MSTRSSIWEADSNVMGMTKTDERYCMDIAQAAFASLWTDHRLSRNLKPRLYNLCVCSTLTHSCEAWNLTISPVYNMLLAVRRRRLRYLGHILCIRRYSVVRRTLMAMTGGGNRYPEGSLFMDCQGSELKDLDTLAVKRTALRHKVVLTLLHCTIGHSGSNILLT